MRSSRPPRTTLTEGCISGVASALPIGTVFRPGDAQESGQGGELGVRRAGIDPSWPLRDFGSARRAQSRGRGHGQVLVSHPSHNGALADRCVRQEFGPLELGEVNP